MMTVYFLLLAGLTSFRSKRCLSQVFSMGPVGHFPSSITINPLSDYACKDENRNGTVTDEKDDGKDLPHLADDRQARVAVPPHRLEEALDAVEEMETEDHHGHHVDESDAAVGKARRHHA